MVSVSHSGLWSTLSGFRVWCQAASVTFFDLGLSGLPAPSIETSHCPSSVLGSFAVVYGLCMCGCVPGLSVLFP